MDVTELFYDVILDDSDLDFQSMPFDELARWVQLGSERAAVALQRRNI